MRHQILGRRRAARAGALVLAIATALGLSLSGCSLVAGGVRTLIGGPPPGIGPDGEQGGGDASRTSAPAAPDSAWLNPGYADGLGETWESPEDLCGIADGVAVTSATTATSVHATGTDLATGKQLWQRDQTACGEDATTADAALLSVRTAKPGGEHELTAELVDPRTGTARITSEALTEYSGHVELIGADGSRLVVLLQDRDANKITAITPDGSVEWSEPVPADIIKARCLLLGEAVGCESTERAWVLDAKTGSTLTTFQPRALSEVSWARDGYTYRSESESAARAYRFSGEAVQLGSLPPAAPRLPSVAAGARYALQSFADPSAPLAVDRTGAPVLSAPEAPLDYVFTATGAPFTDFSVGTAYWGVTADGSTVAVSPTALGDTLKILKNDGSEVGRIDTAFDTEAGTNLAPSFSGGFLVTRNVSSDTAVTTVHLPRGFR